MTEDEFVPLLTPTLDGWRMAGRGEFFRIDGDAIESRGGSGLFWFAQAVFEDLVLCVEWRVSRMDDNSGVFLRCPALIGNRIDPAIERGYEIQIDERGFDPETGMTGSPLHLTGAVYKLAPAVLRTSRPVGEWNKFEILALADTIAVSLNGAPVSRLEGGTREKRGHIALQAHHEGSRVQFRNLLVNRL